MMTEKDNAMLKPLMKFIKEEQKGFVKIITIDRPDASNSLNTDVLTELEEVVGAVNSADTRCVIITGGGEKSFVAGADIGTLMNQNPEDAKKWALFGHSVFRKIETLDVPVIAAVNGYAFGGGTELALSCDIRIAAENAVFALPESSLGIVPGFGGTVRLPRLIGTGKAKELLFTGNRLKASEALDLGLVNAVYPKEALMDEAMKLAEKIASNGPIAIRTIKKSVNDGMQTTIEGAIQIEVELGSGCFGTADQKNAMTAFFEKRKPEPFINK
jgi:enoyl-CoA hydratase